MKHRERILATLNHEEPDRCPMQVSFTPEFALRLRDDLRLKGPKTHNVQPGTPLENLCAMLSTITQTPYASLR